MLKLQGFVISLLYIIVISNPKLLYLLSVLQIYQRINIRIVLKALEIWTNGDPYKRGNDRDPELVNFRNYRNEKLVKKIPHDNAQLLR